MIDDLLREVRRRNGLSVRGLAQMAAVSPATIDRIEHGRVSPTRSVDKILESLGYRLEVSAERIDDAPLTRQDRRSLAFHRLVAARFLEEPDSVRSKAKTNLSTMRRADVSGRASPYLDGWDRLLDGPDADVVSALLSTNEAARSLRQVTPFAGVLTPAERALVYPRRKQAHAT